MLRELFPLNGGAAARDDGESLAEKDFDGDPNPTVLAVKKALARRSLRSEIEGLLNEEDSRYRLVVGKSLRMNRAVALAKKAATSKSTIVLLGESGTGKEVFARAIHRWSERSGQPFIAINCVGLSRELLESELFGHERGAFTGALQLKKGKLELAHGGTVLMDEVGDLSPELQTKLLRFIQEREFERVGGNSTIRVDVRIIAATNKNLEKAVRESRFRDDLYYRLNVIPICLPPLRDRKEDILPLVGHFARRFSADTNKKIGGITPRALEKLEAYDWPGNVRELANAVERGVVLGKGPKLSVQDLPGRIVATGDCDLGDMLCYRTAMNLAKKDLIEKALRLAQGNRAAAAKALGIQRTYLSRLVKTLRID